MLDVYSPALVSRCLLCVGQISSFCPAVLWLEFNSWRGQADVSGISFVAQSLHFMTLSLPHLARGQTCAMVIMVIANHQLLFLLYFSLLTPAMDMDAGWPIPYVEIAICPKNNPCSFTAAHLSTRLISTHGTKYFDWSPRLHTILT